MDRDSRFDSAIPWWVGLMAFFALAVLMISFSVLVSAVAVAMGTGTEVVSALATPAGLTIQVAAVSLIFSLTALLVPRIARVPVKPWLAVVPVRPRVYAPALVGVVGLGFVVDEIVFLLHTADPTLFSSDGLDLFNQLFVDAPLGLFVLLTLTVSLGPGIGEELLFRGLLLRSFRADMPAAAALILSSIFFGFIHLNMLQGTGAGLIGVYLGFVALRTGSILPAMAAHALNNLICSLFARFGDDLFTVWDQGHHPAVLLAAALLVAVALFGLMRLPARETTPSSHVRRAINDANLD